jgi:HK97 family phage portal protein
VPVLATDGALRAIRGAAAYVPEYSPPVTDNLWQIGGAYAQAYRAQPSVRTSAEIFARNIAQLGFQLFERLPGDDSRVRDRTSAPARLLERPHPYLTPYELMFITVQQLSVYGDVLLYKEGPAGDRERLYPIHRGAAEPLSEALGAPYRVWFDGQYRLVDASNFIRLWSPDPEVYTRPCSVLHTLRGTLAEDAAGARHRTRLLNNGASWAGVITRPAGAPRWNDPDRERFRNGIRKYAGPGGAGEIVVLEDGMTVQPAAWSPVEIQSHESRKQNAEVIVSTHQIPLPMAGILDHATFSNVKEQHKHLYQDTLGPITRQIELAFRLHLLDEYGMFDSHYFEFNTAAKLEGSFEEQSAAFGQVIGGPLMTPNEGRKRLNLPALPNGDALYPQAGSGSPTPGVVGTAPTPGTEADPTEPADQVH